MIKGETSLNTIDIIIPIYNALDDLKKCLESVQKHTDLDRHRLILINDNSTDERIKPFLQEQRSERIIVIHNDKNMGFSNNINTGMQIFRYSGTSPWQSINRSFTR